MLAHGVPSGRRTRRKSNLMHNGRHSDAISDQNLPYIGAAIEAITSPAASATNESMAMTEMGGRGFAS